MVTAVQNKPQILVIDDEQQIRRLLLTLLSDRYDCREAESAEEALKALKQNHFDLVISDIQMSGMSGLDLLSHLHVVAPDCVAVMISGQRDIESAIAAMRAGAFDYITKPLDIRHVEAAIERALKQSFLLTAQRSYEVQLEELLWQRTAEVNQLAYYDTLTELPNRTLFEDRVTQAVAVARRAHLTLALLFVSLDQLKKVKDTLGHLIGDRLLKGVAARMRGCAGEGATVARLDNEFALLLNTTGPATDFLEMIEAIREVLKAPFDLDGHEIHVTASVGISLFPLDGEDCESLVKNAGAALSRARNSGGNNYQFYTSDMHAIASKRLKLETSLRHAIENDKLILHYQRRFSVDSHEITGVEALVRWRHPQLGQMAPADFIPLAEETGLILPLGEWVLRAACRQNRKWQDQGFAPMRIGVNISARQLQEQSLAGTVAQILHETDLSPEFLELELTESSVMSNAEAAIDVLTTLKTMGVTISIDDFGTGFSSLSYLKRLPIDALKIDQSFVRDLTTDPDDAALVMAIITLAHNLRLRVVAEGVETEEQLRFLHLLRCDEIQGYIFKEPLPADALEPLLVRNPNQLLARTALSA